MNDEPESASARQLIRNVRPGARSDQMGAAKSAVHSSLFKTIADGILKISLPNIMLFSRTFLKRTEGKP